MSAPEVLGERCEAASGACRELDCLIFELLHPEYKPEKRGMYYGEPTGTYFDYVGDGEIDEVAHAPAYTASLDAAMTLVPEGAIVAFTNCSTLNAQLPDLSRSTAMVGHPDQSGRPVEAATPALALTAAALRAQQERPTP